MNLINLTNITKVDTFYCPPCRWPNYTHFFLINFLIVAFIIKDGPEWLEKHLEPNTEMGHYICSSKFFLGILNTMNLFIALLTIYVNWLL